MSPRFRPSTFQELQLLSYQGCPQNSACLAAAAVVDICVTAHQELTLHPERMRWDPRAATLQCYYSIPVGTCEPVTNSLTRVSNVKNPFHTADKGTCITVLHVKSHGGGKLQLK